MSAKKEWLIQRISGGILFACSPYFFSFFYTVFQGKTAFYVWGQNVWNIICVVGFFCIALYHGYLGMVSVVVDYFPNKAVIMLLRLLTLASLCIFIWGIFLYV